MTAYQIKRLVRIHQRAEHHATAYSRLSADVSTQGKARRHQQKAERLYSQVRAIIRTYAQVAT
jgi:hypothetical protein